jgi:hypothetical protein
MRPSLLPVIAPAATSAAVPTPTELPLPGSETTAVVAAAT